MSAFYCNSANVAIYLYNALHLQPQGYGDRIDKSERGYVLWLYAGTASLPPRMVEILNMAFDREHIDIRVRREIIIEAPALGRRQFVGNRFALRLERPGLEDLMATDIDQSTTAANIEMVRYIPKVAQWHMSYIDVDMSYDLDFKPNNMPREGLGGYPFTCNIVRDNAVVVSWARP